MRKSLKPKCPMCGKKDKVYEAVYADKDVVWEKDWECERCHSVVKVIYKRKGAI